MSFAGFTSPPTGTGADGWLRRDAARAERGAALVALAVTSIAGSASPGAELNDLPRLITGDVRRTSPRAGFFGSSTGGAVRATGDALGVTIGFAFREAG